MIQKGPKDKDPKPHLRCRSLGLTHLGFADDISVFCKGAAQRHTVNCGLFHQFLLGSAKPTGSLGLLDVAVWNRGVCCGLTFRIPLACYTI